MFTSKFTVTKMEKCIKEKHVTVVCGVPLIEKYVYEYALYDTQASHLLRHHQDANVAKHQEKPSTDSNPDRQYQSENDLSPKGLPNSIWPAIIIVMSILVLILAYCTFQYIAIKNCPEKLHLDISKDSVQQCAAKLNEMEGAWNTTKEENDKLSEEIGQIIASKNHSQKKLKEAEVNLKSLKSELESTKQRENNLQTENANLKSEKENLHKDLDATKYTLGNCKNKNMDHEVRSLELLQEIEGLKKELKAC